MWLLVPGVVEIFQPMVFLWHKWFLFIIYFAVKCPNHSDDSILKDTKSGKMFGSFLQENVNIHLFCDPGIPLLCLPNWNLGSQKTSSSQRYSQQPYLGTVTWNIQLQQDDQQCVVSPCHRAPRQGKAAQGETQLHGGVSLRACSAHEAGSEKHLFPGSTYTPS